MTEVRFAPDEKANLQVMFSSMSHCQSLHPDPEGAENLEDEAQVLTYLFTKMTPLVNIPSWH